MIVTQVTRPSLPWTLLLVYNIYTKCMMWFIIVSLTLHVLGDVFKLVHGRVLKNWNDCIHLQKCQVAWSWFFHIFYHAKITVELFYWVLNIFYMCKIKEKTSNNFQCFIPHELMLFCFQLLLHKDFFSVFYIIKSMIFRHLDNNSNLE